MNFSKSNSIGLQQTQKLTISPQLQHAIKLLQLSSLELVEKVETELLENPFLEEVVETVEDKNSREKKEQQESEYDNRSNNNLLDNKSTETQDHSNDDNYFEDSSDSGFMRRNSSKSDENSKQQFLENAFAVQTTIYEHLITQLRLLDVSDEEFQIGEVIISSLDDDGYLKVPIQELSISIDQEENKIVDVLKMIQSLDPPGIGARNLQETLIIQLEQLDEKNELAEKIVKNDLQLLEKAKLKQIASKYDCTIDQVKNAVKIISNLEPIPARQFDSQQTRYIVPDIIVKKVEHGFSISIDDYYLPTLKLNDTYKDMINHEKVSGKAKEFFNNKYFEAKLLIFSLEKRKSTIAKVVEQIIEHQKEFFEKGPQFLQPMVLRDIGEKIGLHESTISRVTSNKYMETPWGIFNLKYFFSSGIRKSTGEMKSSRSIKEIIKEIIENENGEKALSDDQIVKILSNRGINIARRTVAKYRKSLKILSSFQRKEKLKSY